ncbi:peptide-methionine (R)-S-oxide reductase [Chitinophaga skermanii]|uniref:Peptide methionine sulfoxide reductase MsrB n=2 Tax=Chitinophaga skermanii TaxID=331697 RepID=A0A327Q482_9BACT|nr:peptide-methionine (R)-S-oxide reductase [Chitinophaga skermanii]
MPHKIHLILMLLYGLLIANCSYSQNGKKMEEDNKNPVYSRKDTGKVNLTNNEWKRILPNEVYQIAREKGTEWAFTGKYWNTTDKGTYYCAACGNPLFVSDTKFESGCGWPSFYEPISKTSVIYAPDNTHGMQRTEVMCGRCKAHLGHVFDDGPPPTGLRYCINSVILDFEKAQDAEKKYNEKHP